MQFVGQVRIRLISHMIKDISKDLQKLLKYFHGTAIEIFFVLPSPGTYPATFSLDLKDSEL